MSERIKASTTQRTEYWIGQRVMSGRRCENCGVTYAACSKRIFDQARPACCGSCHDHDTHDVKEASIPPPPERVVYEVWRREGLEWARWSRRPNEPGYRSAKSAVALATSFQEEEQENAKREMRPVKTRWSVVRATTTYEVVKP